MEIKSNEIVILHSYFDTERFPDRSKLRGGVYFVDKLPKTHNGKIIRKEITDFAAQSFRTIKDTDPDIQSYLDDYPEEFRKLI